MLDRREVELRATIIAAEDDPLGIRRQVSVGELRAADAALGARLPDDYAWFVLRYWTGIFGGVDLYELDGSIGERQPPGAAGRFVAFADDGCGNAFCFPVADGVCVDRVVILPLLESEHTGDTVDGGFLDFMAARV